MTDCDFFPNDPACQEPVLFEDTAAEGGLGMDAEAAEKLGIDHYY